MGLFSKKVKKSKEKKQEPVSNVTLSLPVQEIPKEALGIIYKAKMDEYDKLNGKANDQLQMELSIIWKFLREGANSEYFEFFEKRGIKRSVIQQANTNDLEKMKQHIEKAEQAVQELTKPNDLESETEKLITEKIKQDRIRIQKQNDIEEKFTSNWETPKNVFDKLIKSSLMKESQSSVNLDNDQRLHTISEKPKVKFETDEPFKPEQQIQYSQDKETKKETEPSFTDKEHGDWEEKQEQKKEKTGSSFFKKKIKKKPLPDKPLKTETQKTNPIKQIMSKKPKELPTYNNELICTICGHYLKNHHKGGENSGCNKCGCLKTIQEITKQHDEPVQQSAKVIESNNEDQFAEEESKILKGTGIVSVKDLPPEMIKQAKQLETLKTPQPKVVTQTNNQQQMTDEKCTCDHAKEKHYENKFCFDCNCSRYTPYKKDETRLIQKKVKNEEKN